MKKILVVDIGGTTVKLMISRNEKRKFPSGTKLAPGDMVAQINKSAADWEYEAISLGFPAPIVDGRILNDPKHLAKGWMKFDWRKAFPKPLRLINDAAMQALGSYHGGRMLFLGLGTGLGSCLIWDRNILPLELGDLPYPGTEKIEDVMGKGGLTLLGKKAWQREVTDALKMLKRAFIADYLVIGGGNAKQLSDLPEGMELGHNRNAFLGGCRLWQTDPRSKRPRWNVIS